MRTKIMILSVCMAVACSIQVQAQFFISSGNKPQQDTITQVQLTVQYRAVIILDTLKKDKTTEETMMLEIGKGISKFYSYTKYVCDSILNVDFANKASQETINEHLKQYGKSKLSETTFKGYPSGKVTTLDEIAGLTCLRCEEKEEVPQWTLGNDTSTILSYSCRKAECEFKGRKWTAWFTSDIPVSEGPWKLHGLPGLIIKAEDEEKQYTFVCTGLEQSHSSKPILFYGKNYELVNRKAYNKVHERYNADPVGFITGSNPNVKITISDDQGNQIKGPRNMPYNPLERE